MGKVSFLDTLIGQRISEARNRDDRFAVVAEAVNQYLNQDPGGILYEAEAARAILRLQQRGTGFLTQSDPEYLPKPKNNPHYTELGIKSRSIRDAILQSISNQDGSDLLIHFEAEGQKKSRQKFDTRLILYKEEERLRSYVLSRTASSKVVTCTFRVPKQLITRREGTISI